MRTCIRARSSLCFGYGSRPNARLNIKIGQLSRVQNDAFFGKMYLLWKAMIIQIVARVRGMAPAMNCGRVAVVSGAISSTFMLKMFYRGWVSGVQRGWWGEDDELRRKRLVGRSW